MEQQSFWILVAGWLLFFISHSLLASVYIKERVARYFPKLVRFYRFFYNVLALLIFVPLILYMKDHTGLVLWQWHPPIKSFLDILALCAFAGIGLTLIGFNIQEFLGLRQLRTKSKDVYEQGGMHISVVHRYIRHPWYFLILVILWTRDIGVAQLVTYILFTLYFIIGSRLEERKLLMYYGEAYAQYMKKVPGIIPFPGRHLSKQEALDLLELSSAKD